MVAALAVGALATAANGHAHPPAAAAPLGQPQTLHDPSGQAMAAFLRAKADPSRRAVVAFYGASHTAADLLTGELRRNWQSGRDAGHGFLLPAKWNLGYRHQDVQVAATAGWQIHRHLRIQGDAVGDYGYAGLRMCADNVADAAEVSTTVANPLGRAIDHLELWVRMQPDGGDLAVDIDGATATVTTKGAAKVQRMSYDLRDGPHRLKVHPAGNGPVCIDGVVAERGKAGVVVDQLGIPGMTAGIQLHWQYEPWAEQVRWRDPALIVLAYGTNDVSEPDETAAHYLDTWRKVLGRIRKAAPQASCLLVGPTDRLTKAGRQWQPLPHTPMVISVQRQAAAEFGCAHFDAQAAMGGPGSMARWVEAGLATRDHVHLTADGYRRLAQLLESAIERPAAPPSTGKPASVHGNATSK